MLDALESGELHGRRNRRDHRAGASAGRRARRSARMDIAGLDMLAHVRRNLHERLPALDARRLRGCRRSSSDGRAGLIGEKAGQRLLQAREGAGGESRSSRSIRSRSSTGRRRRSRLPSLDAAKSIDDVGERMQDAVQGQGPRRRVPARDARRRRSSTRAQVAPDDRRTRSTTSTARCNGASAGSSGRSRRSTRSASRRRGRMASGAAVDAPLPPCWRRSSSAGNRFAAADRRRPPRPADASQLAQDGARSSVKKNAGASLVDLGDGVLARRVPLEDERDRRRHAADAHAGVREARAQLRRAGRRQRGAELLRRREPDAAAARSAGGQLGRGRPDGARVPGRHWRCATPRAGRRRAGRPGARRRLRDCAARRSRAGGGRNLHRPGRSGRRADSRRRRHEGDGGARGRRAAAGRGPAAAVQRVFETIGFAKVSTSAPDARRLGYLREWTASR